MSRIPYNSIQAPASPPSRRLWLQSGVACLLSSALPARALDKPTGPVVLTVSGRVRQVNEGGSAQFDMGMLEAIPQQNLVTRTPWFAQARRFTGPLLRDVLTRAGANGSMLRLIALNDYRVDMPMDDAQRHDVVLARLIDDKPMTVRDKGPLFIIYPFDSKPELRSAVYYSRSAWQLRTIEVL
jgi:hypothetical protein